MKEITTFLWARKSTVGCERCPLHLMEKSAGWPLVIERWGWRGPGDLRVFPPLLPPRGCARRKTASMLPSGLLHSAAADAAPRWGREHPSDLWTPLAPELPPQSDRAQEGTGWPQRTYLSSTDHKPGHGYGAGARYRVPSRSAVAAGSSRPALSSALGGQLTRRKPEARTERRNLGSVLRPPPALGRASRR